MDAIDIVGRFRAQGEVPGAEARWWGSTVRGALGTALKNLLCTVHHRRCDRCRRRWECPFPRLWEPRRQDTRGPLLQLPPWLVRVAWREGQLAVVLRLFGPARDQEARFRIALEAALARGLTRACVPFFPAASLTTQGAEVWCPPKEAQQLPLVVHFLSPVRLVIDGKPEMRAPDFNRLIASIRRRWQLASLTWGWPPPPVRLPDLAVAMAHGETTWRDLNRRSARQRTNLTLGGLVGQLVYDGPWAEALPFLQAASLMGVGKLTTHGFGHVAFGVQHRLPGQREEAAHKR